MTAGRTRGPGRPDHRGDGDGWTRCEQGHRHWGLFGASGLLLQRPAGDSVEVLLQHRAEWSHHGGTWGLLGGARESSETAVQAALREAAEEGGVDVESVTVHGRFDDPHGGWAYTTVLGTAPVDAPARPTGGESIDVGWFSPADVDRLPLHPGFSTSWPALRDALRPLTVVVDAANVVGSRPDGWWRDRAGAARRLVADLTPLAADGLPDARLPDDLPRAGLSHWWPRVVVVVEGAARAAAEEASDHPGMVVVAAAGSGDDAVADAAAAAAAPGGPAGDPPGGPAGVPPGAPVLVVTADRELRRRVASTGAAVTGPGWLEPFRG
ncbi:MAG TPA: NUDIX domain-containing protein [Actinomycetes bacterium]|nr:NUDIX domain-containing protein [Actinomycetes bacterium]